MVAEKTEGASSIRKALAVLNSFNPERTVQTLTQIATSISYPLSTVSRIVSVLCEEGFLEKRENTFRLGWQCCRLGGVFAKADPVVQLALPVLYRLRDELNETASLYLRNGLYRVCAEQVQSRHMLKISTLGITCPIWIGASGKAFLAFVAEKELMAILDMASPEIKERIPNIMHELQLIRKYGFATSLGEREQNVSSVAVPVFGTLGQQRAALVISGPSQRCTENLVKNMVDAVIASGRELSLAIGAPDSCINFEPVAEYPKLQ